MQLHNLKPVHKSKNKKRIGRGGKRGTYCGRGIKGQKARAGAKIRPEIRDIIKKIPKKRGYRFKSIKEKFQIVSLEDLEKNFSAKGGSASGGETLVITPEILLKAGLIARVKGKMPKVKILLARRSPAERDEDGGLKKKLKIENCLMSKSAEKILKK